MNVVDGAVMTGLEWIACQLPEKMAAQLCDKLVEQLTTFQKPRSWVVGRIAHLVSRYPAFVGQQLLRLWPEVRHMQESYSQEGEDLLLARLLEGAPPGFFVDV